MKKKIFITLSFVLVVATLLCCFSGCSNSTEEDALQLKLNDQLITFPCSIAQLEQYGITPILNEDIIFETGRIYTPMGYVSETSYPVEVMVCGDREEGDYIVGLSFFDKDSPFTIMDGITIGSSAKAVLSAFNGSLRYSKEEFEELNDGEKTIEYIVQDYIVNITISYGEVSRISIESKSRTLETSS